MRRPFLKIFRYRATAGGFKVKRHRALSHRNDCMAIASDDYSASNFTDSAYDRGGTVDFFGAFSLPNLKISSAIRRPSGTPPKGFSSSPPWSFR